MLNLHSSAIFYPIGYFFIKIFPVLQIFKLKMHTVSPVMRENRRIVDPFMIHFNIQKVFVGSQELLDRKDGKHRIVVEVLLHNDLSEMRIEILRRRTKLNELFIKIVLR